MPFDDDSNKPNISKKPALKLNNSNSMFANIPKKPSKQEFDQSVSDYKERSSSYKERAAEVAITFKKFLDDKTISENKGPFAANLERELLGKIGQLAMDMNADEQEEEGMGSVGLMVLLFRTFFIQRDKINYLDYSINLLEKRVKDLELSLVDKAKISE